MKTDERKEARALRQKGHSIKHIAAVLGVAKSSASVWVRDVSLTKAQKIDLKEKQHSFEVIENRRAARLRNESAKREVIMSAAESTIKSISKQDLRLIGASLYWAEGAKRNTRSVAFSNSDPLIVRIMMKFFKEVCGVPDEKFRAHIHTYSHLNARTAENYWSNITGIPLGQFFKTYSKPSKAGKGKMDALPYGTLDICIGDVRVFLAIMGWNRKIGRLLLGNS
jgi:hypothetical protein